MRALIDRLLVSLRSWQFWLGLGISVGCLILVFRGVNVEELASALRAAEYVWLLPAIVLLASSMVVRAIRWRTLFFPHTGLRLLTFFRILNISYLANNILPARAGDIIRAGLISTREPVGVSQALATVVVERVLDGLTLVLMLVFLLPFFPVPDWVARGGLVAGVALFMAGIALMILATQQSRTVRWAHAILGRIPRIDGGRWAAQIDNLVDGLAVLRSPTALGQAGVWSLVVWLLSGVAYYSVLRAFDLPLSMAAGLFVLVVTTLVQIVPATPGYVGVFDYTGVLALSVFGVERNLALSCVIVMHAVAYVTFCTMGIISLVQESLSLSAVAGLDVEAAD